MSSSVNFVKASSKPCSSFFSTVEKERIHFGNSLQRHVKTIFLWNKNAPGGSKVQELSHFFDKDSYSHRHSRQELSEDKVVRKRQPNWNGNCQLVSLKSNVKVFVYRRHQLQEQQRWGCRGYDNSSSNIYVPANQKLDASNSNPGQEHKYTTAPQTVHNTPIMNLSKRLFFI